VPTTVVALRTGKGQERTARVKHYRNTLGRRAHEDVGKPVRVNIEIPVETYLLFNSADQNKRKRQPSPHVHGGIVAV